MNILTESADDTERAGERLGASLERGVVVLCGPLGSGKTTFTKGLARGLGIPDTITSPTFTIAAEYEGRALLRHIDLYRTGSDEELELIGLGDLVSGDAVTVIEWGEKAESFLPTRYIRVDLAIRADGKREIGIRRVGSEHTAD